MRRGGIQVGELQVLALPGPDGLPVQGAGCARHAKPSLLQDGLVDDAQDRNSIIQQGDEGAEEGLP